jgi:hypothetical protein
VTNTWARSHSLPEAQPEFTAVGDMLPLPFRHPLASVELLGRSKGGIEPRPAEGYALYLQRTDGGGFVAYKGPSPEDRFRKEMHR